MESDRIQERLNDHQGRLAATEARVEMIQKQLSGINRRLDALIFIGLAGIAGLIFQAIGGG